jgi:NAD(P)-dependent dehydrogenase (short-subunit alcohol dehydrogenase family)
MTMERVALVTGADRGLGLALCAGLLERGWRVVAGQYMPEWPELGALAGRHSERLMLVPLDVSSDASARTAAKTVEAEIGCLDVLINNAGVNSPATARPIREPQDYGEMQRLYDVNALGPLRVVEAFLPLLDRGGMKRLCFVSSEAGSIGACKRTSWHGYCMSKAALNMSVQILHNLLRPEGYTFRLYHPGWMRSYMGGQRDPRADLELEEAVVPALAYFLGDRDDEDRLVMRDWQGREWPW